MDIDDLRTTNLWHSVLLFSLEKLIQRGNTPFTLIFLESSKVLSLIIIGCDGGTDDVWRSRILWLLEVNNYYYFCRLLWRTSDIVTSIRLCLIGMGKIDRVILGWRPFLEKDTLGECTTFSTNKVVYVSVVTSLCFFLYFFVPLYCSGFL